MSNKPFLKWAGNKHRIMPIIEPLLGNGDRLIEPFAGSGAVFMASNFPRYFLCDINADLIGLFNNLKYNTSTTLAEIANLFDGTHNTEEEFYNLRKTFNNLDSYDIVKSAIFVYLNRHAFNGMCRYNSKKQFNVPYGKYKSVYYPIEELKNFIAKSAIADFVNIGFEDSMNMAVNGDVVYCDPPYVPLSVTSNFTNYSGDGFGIDEQKKLANIAFHLKTKNIPVIISNHDTPVTRQLYTGTSITTLDVHRSISSKKETRGKAKELIAVF